jgi:hypothetical protein
VGIFESTMQIRCGELSFGEDILPPTPRPSRTASRRAHRHCSPAAPLDAQSCACSRLHIGGSIEYRRRNRRTASASRHTTRVPLLIFPDTLPLGRFALLQVLAHVAELLADAAVPDVCHAHVGIADLSRPRANTSSTSSWQVASASRLRPTLPPHPRPHCLPRRAVCPIPSGVASGPPPPPPAPLLPPPDEGVAAMSRVWPMMAQHPFRRCTSLRVALCSVRTSFSMASRSPIRRSAGQSRASRTVACRVT